MIDGVSFQGDGTFADGVPGTIVGEYVSFVVFFSTSKPAGVIFVHFFFKFMFFFI